jgi:hypothetical protein
VILWWACLAAEATALVAAVRHGHRVIKSAVGYKIRHWLYFSPRSPIGALALLLLVPPVVDPPMLLLERHLRDLPRPFVGTSAALYLTHLALTLAWPAALAAGSWAVFVPFEVVQFQGYPGTYRRDPIVVAAVGAAWALVVLAVAVAHPLPRGWTAPLIHGCELAAVAVGAAAVVRAWTPGRRWARSPAHQAILVLLATELAVCVIGPFARDPFADWDAARVLYVLGFVGVAGVLARGTRSRAASIVSSASE